MSLDSPRIGGYTLLNPPDSMVVIPEVIQQVNELADGGTRQRILGYRIHATLTWDSNWIRQQDLTGIATVANDTSASLTFIPRPDTYATRTYEVIWINKFQLFHSENRLNRWGGSIELISPTPTATVPELP